jgi:hypothetical protein
MVKNSLALIVAFLLITNAKAQIPGGAIFWLRADTNVTHDNGTVSDWSDAGVSTHSAYQTIPISQPKYLADTINQLPAIHFDGRYNFMNCAPIFPDSEDYTVSMVATVYNFARTNYFLSGNQHTIYTQNSAYPTVRNDTFPAPYLTSSIPLISGKPAIITVSYRQSNQFASIFIDGEFADSGFIGTNSDKNIYLGGFQAAPSFFGDFAEIILYPKVLTYIGRRQLESYFFKKYAIPPPFAPDSIYSAIPKHLGFYAREADDSATTAISGNYYDIGYDSIYLLVYKNDTLLSRSSQPLIYHDGKAPFAFAPRIHAELSEYTFSLSVKSDTEDRHIAMRDSVVCGDAFLIDGQSNSINNNLGYTNEFYRTFGLNQSNKTSDTSWEISDVTVGFGGGAEAGSWGVRLQELMKDTYKIPTCIINGGVGGTSIKQHLRDPLNPTNLLTIYGSMLYRVQKSNVASKAKALFWYQGESDVITNYANNFQTLYDSWKEDYPSVKKIYVMQVRPGCSAGFSADVRDFLRTLQDSYKDSLPMIESVSTMGLPGHDGCHFAAIGYSQLGDQLFRLVARDFYGSSDNSQITSPNIWQAYYTNSAHTEIGLSFMPPETRFTFPKDTIVGGLTETLKDYFFLNDTGEVVQSISTIRNRVFLTLKQSSAARLINYLPDKFYNHTDSIYEGPWLENTRGLGAFSFYHIPIVDSALAEVNRYQNGTISLRAYPNPSNGKFDVRFSIPYQENVSITISDLFGRAIAFIATVRMSEGEHTVVFDTNSLQLSDGVYICKLQAGESINLVKLFIQH